MASIARSSKAAAMSLSGTVTTLTGPYRIVESGKQLGMQYVIQQNLKDGPKVVFPETVKTAEPVFPAPGWATR